MNTPSSKRPGPWLAAIIAFGALIRLGTLFALVGGRIVPKPFWYDEAYSALFAGQGPLGALSLSFVDTSPGLFVVLLSFWSAAAGAGDLALSLFPYLLSSAAPFLMYLLGRELGGKKVGLIAAAFTAMNPLHVQFASELRAYSLLFDLGILSTFFLWRWTRDGRRTHLAWWAVFAVLGMYTHYTSIVLLAPQVLYAVWASRARREIFLDLLVALGVMAVAYVPQLVLFDRWADLFNAPGEGPSSFVSRAFSRGDAGTVFIMAASFFFGARHFFAGPGIPALVTVLAGSAAMAALGMSAWRSEERSATGFMAWLTVGGVLTLMAGRLVYAPRYVLLLAVPAIVIVSLGAVTLSGRRLAAAVAAFALMTAPALFLSYVAPAAKAFTYYGPTFAGIIEGKASPGDLVLLDHFTEVLFRRYYGGHADTALFFPVRGENVTDLRERFRLLDYDYIAEGDRATLERLVAGRDRVWTVDFMPQGASIQDPGGLKRTWLEKDFSLTATYRYPESGGPDLRRTVLYLYVKKAPVP